MTDDIQVRLYGIEARLNTIGQRIGSSSTEGILGLLGRIEITMAVTGRQVERITGHLGLVTDEDGAPARVLPPEPFTPPALDQYMLAWLSRIRDIAGNSVLSDAQTGERVRELLFPRHIHAGDGTAEGCPGCFPPGEVIPRTLSPDENGRRPS